MLMGRRLVTVRPGVNPATVVLVQGNSSIRYQKCMQLRMIGDALLAPIHAPGIIPTPLTDPDTKQWPNCSGIHAFEEVETEARNVGSCCGVALM